ncbi:DUF6497 family protein [uncultured Tateyamaria sp.]|uniref:DUF6497 family protein n=1 Tax=uncultured Tateyamaria sp. TaxID=455651 RepID=UPI0026092704|nr:DUF6497 family protein [uncultured Tateyamaria sp.]
MSGDRQHTEPNGIVRRVITARTAAPEGGARSRKRSWVRGCVSALCLAASTALAQEVPSGQPVSLSEVLLDAVGAENWVRFRFIAPEIAKDTGTVSYGQAEGDFQALCDDFAMTYLTDFELTADVVVISLMDRPVPFGTSDPEATQFFEAFRPETDGCVWEAF